MQFRENNLANACGDALDIGFASLNYIQVGILGVIQGITELLPISSTAHMRIVPALLGWRDPGSAFSAAMQLAALAAVVSYFWRDVAAVSTGSASAIRRRDFNSPWFRLAVAICLATIPIGLAGLALSSVLNSCESPLRSLMVIGVSSVAMAVLLAIAEVVCRHRRNFDQLRLRDALIVGVAQIGALIPGVSRSGSTLTAALFLNFRREEAARLSFLLGLPAIALAGLKELWVLLPRPHSCGSVGLARVRPARGEYLGIRCDLGSYAIPGTIFRLAVCHLSGSTGNFSDRIRSGGCFTMKGTPPY
ncbi:undecaprenyl-diphosphate phosphatase [Pseudoduganella sp. UC29_71]|uniref:undecaprenyl-diphosphate phosphatase n=1 Tax=Pseudoduganella sp. UC29_71 TaxID=3350174 RepID=UPI00366D1693